jgi:hypothetical protein
VLRPHPLDVGGTKRVLGETYYDPWSKSWKEDDLRPRGIEWETGNVACTGKCKVKRPWWAGGGTRVKCPCNKGGGGCVCDGCLGGAVC